MLVSVFTKVRHLSLSQLLHHISLITILISSYHMRLALAICLFPSALPTKVLHAFLFPPVRATCPTNASPPLFEIAIPEFRIWKEGFIAVIK